MMMNAAPGQFEIKWLDRQRAPQCPPNPDYPTGIDLFCVANGVGELGPTCKVELPYPAARCGIYMVRCRLCGVSIGCTTAGRPDDPRSLTIECQLQRT